MKNLGITLLLLICSVCVAFTGGLFVGRNANHAQIQISVINPPATGGLPSGNSESATQPMNINTATVAQLEQLPGIGPSLAQKIVAYREENGAFSSVGELVNVSGIGTGKLESILNLITVGG